MTITAKTIFFFLAASLTIIAVWPKLFTTPISQPQNEQVDDRAIEQFLSQEDSRGNVTVTVKPLTLFPGQKPVFEVVFDTHSVNLDFDIVKISRLADDQGRSYGASVWDGTPPGLPAGEAGGHHRRGTLTFPQPLNSSAKTITLTLTNIAGIPTREFSWEREEVK